MLDTGHIELDHTSREGESGSVWYRGPLIPRPGGREVPDANGILPLLFSSDQARRIGPDGKENLSLAAAFEIGRMLALAEPSVVASLLLWRKDGLALAARKVLLSLEPTLTAVSDLSLALRAGTRAGAALLASLGKNNATRLGIFRPPKDLGLPIPGIDGFDPVAILSAGLGVPASVVNDLMNPGVRRAGGVAVPIAPGATALKDLVANPAEEMGALSAAAQNEASRLAQEALQVGPNIPGTAARAKAAPRCPRSAASKTRGGALMVRASFLDNPLCLQATKDAVALHGKSVIETPLGEILPDPVRQWLARIRLLEGVPFAQLVPDSELLPPESIRFFYLDREWTDALVQGALSVSAVTTLDREDLQEIHARLRDEIDTEERRLRLVGSDAPGTAPANTVSGFLLRSRAVSGYPALHVRGFNAEIVPDDGPEKDDDPRRIRLLRLERLAPAVLLCLFDEVPVVVHVEEPHQGVQFGVDLAVGADGTTGATLPLRDVSTGLRLDRENPIPSPPTSVDVPFRLGSPGVIHLTELANRIAAQPATHTDAFEGPGVGPAEMAMQLLRFPYRQVFGDPAKGTVGGGNEPDYGTLFRPKVGIGTLREWNQGVPE